ncbi:unnamed protein product [Lathyrus oleraceus]|nr:uncharacterized protein LOC127125757 [Pisum sativum]XP_050910535.1 uncharacterized protein LOC127125757 [Pisum sativum]KAI5425767.1 hypothetical protein KIW84_031546 [Pisum sativum]
MAKKKMKTPIDRVPKHSQQPRSSPPKRRTDFSFFNRAPPSFSNFAIDSSPGSSSDEVRLSNVTASSSLERRMMVKQFYKEALVRCSKYQEGRPVCSSESFDVSVAELDSVDLCGNRDACIKMPESTPRESSVSDNSSPAVTPGNVIWARTTCKMWWPAEVMEERCALSDCVTDGHVLVQFYGNHPSAWIDPATDISIFEDSFEERSNNPSNDFQVALKQALQRKIQLSSCQNLSPDTSAHSTQHDRSSGKYTSPSSSRTINEFQERRRGKRERKPKLHFDEVSYPIKTEKKDRRLKIMRYLGLAPPVGSPF